MAKRNLFAGKLIFLLLNFTQLNLHYSQTIRSVNSKCKKFYCILNLHYSQTFVLCLSIAYLFYCILNLHYSQTTHPRKPRFYLFYCILNLHYSQTNTSGNRPCNSFTVFWIYTTLKPRNFRAFIFICFTVFWIYTTLKL